MNSSKPRVSVVLPVYNGRRYVREAVDSILNQTFRDFELIVIDDGSTDDSLEILKGYAAVDPRIRIVTQSNQGVTAALNAGLAVAHGQYVARMDADDISFPERFEKQVLYLDAHPEVAVLGTQAIHMDEEGRPISSRVRMPCEPLKIACRMVSLWPAYHPSVMFRRDLILSLGGYRDLEGGEDCDLWLRVSAKARLANLQDCLLQYRIHEQSVTKTKKFSRRVEAYVNSSEELFDIPAAVAGRLYERRCFFYVFPWIWRSAGRIAARFNVSRLKVLLCKEFLDAWLYLAWKQDPFTTAPLVLLYAITPF